MSINKLVILQVSDNDTTHTLPQGPYYINNLRTEFFEIVRRLLIDGGEYKNGIK